MTFQTKYKRNEFEGEKNSGKSKTEQAGYRSTAQIIRDFQAAGERLEARRLGYEYNPGEKIPDNPMALSRSLDVTEVEGLKALVDYDIQEKQKAAKVAKDVLRNEVEVHGTKEKRDGHDGGNGEKTT